MRAIQLETIEALVEAAVSTCEPENADEQAAAYTRRVLREKFRAILDGGHPLPHDEAPR